MSIFMRIPLSILMLCIEPISHLARVVSLTVRLYGNMFAGDMVILVFLSLIPIGIPVAFHRTACFCCVCSGVRFCFADHGILGGRSGG